ncbi:hypothetical protein ElyMa_006476700 [Elysia marginata]|uniref:Uncharacterized protein n=1 Tax=Elysia marginata TaxID=1093978 RepID=A0AAV4I3U0_9GAST|nr:hypothetical protein ElyMa_006476700 [Elysia marginata]
MLEILYKERSGDMTKTNVNNTKQQHYKCTSPNCYRRCGPSRSTNKQRSAVQESNQIITPQHDHLTWTSSRRQSTGNQISAEVENSTHTKHGRATWRTEWRQTISSGMEARAADVVGTGEITTAANQQVCFPTWDQQQSPLS